MSRCFTLLLTCTVVLGGCASSGPVAPPARLYDGVDACAREVSTHSAAAQEWFDQGLTLLYGFNHEEAIRSFQRATELDPGCSMAWWGLAMASGIDLNNSAMTEDDSRRAWDAAQQAAATAPGASPVEAALAKAITTRYTWPAPEDRSELDVAYAQAMEAVSKEFPADPDVACVYADSLMLLQPWDYWTAEGEPKGRIEEAIAVLEVVLAEEPDHAGACHFYIHALEAGQPERAIAAADRLLNRVPGAGHLLHMPSHIYVHVGRFADASDCNEIAIAADEAYFAVAPAHGFYQLYYAHNLHMLAFSAMMEGREKLATETAAQLVADIPASF
ncbi:MAG: tetratricopeptide (TPR) repeat protein, partial [Pseudohongiellaceae bacterium]